MSWHLCRGDGRPAAPGSITGTDWSAAGVVPTDAELLAEMDPNAMWREIKHHAGQGLLPLL